MYTRAQCNGYYILYRKGLYILKYTGTGPHAITITTNDCIVYYMCLLEFVLC